MEENAAAAKKETAPEDTPLAPEPDEQATQSSGGEKTKKRTWKKPKDKPKRPLSAYNIFFQHQRTRIIEGHTAEASPEETVRSIEAILTKSKEKRRHRKSHGRIGFGDLARAIAEQWKTINPNAKSIFDHYAEVDMLRYRRELKLWREKKEMESEANAMAKHSDFVNSMNASFSSASSAGTGQFSFDGLPDESQETQPSINNASFSSAGSGASFFSLEPEPIQTMIDRQQQQVVHQQQILERQWRDAHPGLMGAPYLNEQRRQMPYVHGGANNLQSSLTHTLPNAMPSNLTAFNSQIMRNLPYGDLRQQHQANAASFFEHHNRTRLSQTNPFGGGVPHIVGQSSFNNSIHLGDVLLGQSNHVSDHSSSHTSAGNTSAGNTSAYSTSLSQSGGFAFNQSSSLNSTSHHSGGFHASDGLLPPSSSHRDNAIPRQSNYFLQQQEHQHQQHHQQQASRSSLDKENDVENNEMDVSGNSSFR